MNRAQRLRFWAKVDMSNPHGCWIWTSARAGQGDGDGPPKYGVFWLDRRTVYAHRTAYEEVYGRITEETIDHLCNTQLCVRPKHMEPVSKKVNTERAWARRGGVKMLAAV